MTINKRGACVMVCSSKLALGGHSLSKPNLAAYSFTLSVGHGHEVNIVLSSTASLEDQ